MRHRRSQRRRFRKVLEAATTSMQITRKLEIDPISIACIVILLFLAITVSVKGQELTSRPERGLIGKGTIAASEIDNINLQNGSVSLALPLASLPPMAGGKLSYTLTAYYNSKLWNGQSREEFGTTTEPGCQPIYTTKQIVAGETGAGWRIGGQFEVFFRDATEDLQYIQPTSQACGGDEYFHMQGRFFKPMLRMPDGSEHEMRIEGDYPTYRGERTHLARYYQYLGPSPVFQSPIRLYTTDGTYLTAIYRPPSDPVQWTIYMKDGTRIEQSVDGQRTIDRNGNSVLVKLSYVASNYSFARDEQTGREIRWSSSTYNGSDATKVEYQSVGGAWQTVWVVWGTTTVRGKLYTRTAWNPGDGAEARGAGPCFFHDEFAYPNLRVVRQIILPATSAETPLKYLFQYNSDSTEQATDRDVRPYCNTNPMPELQTYTRTASVGLGELSKITTPLGAQVEYEYRNDHSHKIGSLVEESSDDLLSSVITKKVVTHDGEVDTWKYEIDHTGTASGGRVVNPDGSYFSESYNPVNVWNPAAATDGFGGLQLRADSSGHTRVEKHWTLLGGELFAYGAASNRVSFNPVVDTEYTTLLAADRITRLKMSAKRYIYDYNGELLQTIEYDWFDPSAVPFENNDPNRLPLAIPPGARVLKVTVNSLHNQASDSSSVNAYQKRGPDPAAVILGKPYEVAIGDGASATSVTRFRYDGLADGAAPTKGNLTATMSADNFADRWITTQTIYSARGNPVTQIDANGNRTEIMYGSVNGFTDLYPTRSVQASGTSVARTSALQYDFFTGLPTVTTDIDNNVSAMTDYDSFGRPTRIRSAVGTSAESWMTAEYGDVARRVITRSDVEAAGDGRKVSIQHYDELGRIRLSRQLEDPFTQDPYDERQGIKVETRYKITYDAASETGFTYQAISKPFRASSAVNAANEPTMGWTRTKTWSTGIRNEMEDFSGSGLPSPWGTNSSTTGVSATMTESNMTTATDQAGKARRNLTDALGRLIRVDEPDATGNLGSPSTPRQPTNYFYDPMGRLVHVQQGIQDRYFMYDSVGRLVRVRQPEQDINTALNTTGNPANNSWTAGFNYDPNGNQTLSIDARNVSITSSYDALNRPGSRSYSDGTPTVTYSYDTAGVPYSRGRLTRTTSSVSETRNIAYDPAGRSLISEQLTDGQTYRSKYKYDRAGTLIEQTYPSGRVAKIFLAADGDQDSVSGRVSNGVFRNYATSLAYTASGALERLQLGNGVWESAELNARGQVTALKLGPSASDSSLWRLDYRYGELNENGSVDGTRNAGNIAMQIISTGSTAPFVETYRYDPLDRITEARETNNGNQTWIQSYGYDRYGNRTSLAQNVGGQVLPVNSTTLPQVDTATNRFQDGQGYTYDKVGDVIRDPSGRQYIFNGDNKQTEVRDSQGTVVGRYFYDGDGRRIKKVVAGETTLFVYDAIGKLVAEFSTGSPTPNPTTNYTATDPLGSPRVLTNKLGQVVSRRDFMPFGEELSADPTYRTSALKYGSADTVRQKFTGYQRDVESGLDFAEARYYNSTHGRFTAVDPLLASGKSADPQTFNRYVYTMNRPLVLTDETGMQTGQTTEDTKTPNLTAPTKLIVTADWRVENDNGSAPVSAEVASILNAAASAMATNIVNAMVAVNAINNFPEQSTTVSLTGGASVDAAAAGGKKGGKVVPTGGSVELKATGEVQYASADPVMRDLQVANDSIRTNVTTAIEDKEVHVPAAMGPPAMMKAGSTDATNAPTLASSLALAVKKVANEQARQFYLRKFPERTIPKQFVGKQF